jgi:hypothetical protein
VGWCPSDRARRDRRVDLHDQGIEAHACDWCDVARETKIELFVERRIDGVRRAGQEERIAVRGRFRGCLGAEIAAGTWSIFDDEWLTEPL